MGRMHGIRSAMLREIGRLALSLLGGLLLVLSLLLSPAAFAATTRTTSPVLSSTGVLDLAGVSVLRLSITYTTTQKKPVTCTALGSLIASWPAASTSDQNNWVVTDSSVLSLTGGKCAPAGSSLTSIQLLANTLYTSATSSLTLLDTLTCKAGTCQDQPAGSAAPVGETLSNTPIGGGILFSFHTAALDMQPFLDTGQAAPSSGTGIELATQSQSPSWPQTQPPQSPQVSATQAVTYVMPLLASPGTLSSSLTATPGSSSVPGAAAPTTFEPGMPFVDTQGRFLGMQVLGSNTAFTVGDLVHLEQVWAAFLPEVIRTRANNILKQQWDAGIVAFDLGTTAGYTAAQNDWRVIQNTTNVNNPNFQAARTFSQLAATKLSNNGSTPTTPGAPSTGGINTRLLIVGLVAGVIFLVLLLVLVSLTFGRQRALLERNRASTPARETLVNTLPAFLQGQFQRIRDQLGKRNQSPKKPLQIPTPQIQNATPADGIRVQQAQANLDEMAIQARLQRLWDQADI